MARAKRTERADARRRYRQAQIDAEAAGESAVDPAVARAVETASPPPARPSFTAAFRLAYHRPNLREDLQYLPGLLRHWSFWLPLALMAGTAAIVVLVPGQPLVALAFQTFLYPPAMLTLFIVGFFAKRASYLLGGIVGVANAVVCAGLWLAATRAGVSADERRFWEAILSNAIVLSPPAGVVFAALAAWYRRFLNLSNPNRGRRPAPKAKPKAAGSNSRPALKGR